MLVIKLSRNSRIAIVRHLHALSAEDRRLRFGCAMADAGIHGYVNRIDFERDAIFGVHDAKLTLAGICHVAKVDGLAEFGISVVAGSRRQGIGSALVARAALHARNSGIGELFMHCLSQNANMIRIAQRLGMRIVREGGEADAYLSLAPRDLSSVTDELMQEGLSLCDYSMKTHFARFRWLLATSAPAALEAHD
jgi:RimJ/RimL family protein N-acetyltransferase